MSYDAVAVSSADLAAGIDFFRKQPIGFPWVSANTYNETGKLLFSPYLIKTINTLKVGIIGLTGTGTNSISGITIGDWQKSLKKYMPTLTKSCDIIIILSTLNATDNRVLVENFQDVNFLFTSLKQRGNMAPRITNKTMLTQCAPQGKYLGKLHISWNSKQTWQTTPKSNFTSIFLPVRPVRSGNSVSKIVDQIKKNINDFNKTKKTGLRLKKNNRGNTIAFHVGYAGSSACRQCHQSQWESWSKTAHAHAFSTLIDKNQSFNSECLPCHVTAGNITTSSPEEEKAHLLTLPNQLQSVGCEVCHGPGKNHITSPRKIKLMNRPLRTVCTGCHTKKRDDFFDYSKKMAAIRCPTK